MYEINSLNMGQLMKIFKCKSRVGGRVRLYESETN